MAAVQDGTALDPLISWRGLGEEQGAGLGLGGGGRPAEERCSGHKFKRSVLTSVQRNVRLLKLPVQQPPPPALAPTHNHTVETNAIITATHWWLCLIRGHDP